MSFHRLPNACLAVAIVLGVAPLSADEEVTRVYRVEHADAQVLAKLISRTGPLIAADSALQSVVLTGSRETVDTTLAVLAELDLPTEAHAAKDVVFDVYLVGAYLNPQEFPAMPAVPQHAVDGMRETFPFVSYRLLEAFNIRTTPSEHEAAVTGYLGTEPLIEYRFRIAVDSEEATSGSIGLGRIQLAILVFHEDNGIQESEISTRLTIRESKTIVVGKAGVTGVADGVFLVLRPRLE